MNFNTSFSHFGSISPARSYKNSLKENHNESINSNGDSRLKASISTQQHTQKASTDNLYTLRLESKILQMQKKIDQQRFQIDTLSQETEGYMNLCEEQKKELNSLNIEMLKQEYEEQISELIAEKEKLTELIQNMSEEYRLAESEQENEIRTMKTTNSELAKRIEEGMNRKEALLRQIAAADLVHRENQEIILEQEQRIDSLRNIQRKLFIALRQIESLEKNQ